MTSHWLFSCRNYSRPLAWLRASLSESDNHQHTFCCWFIGTCGYSRKLKMHADTNELPCKQKALIIVEALFQMYPVPVSFITLNMWYPRRSVSTCLVSVFASCFIALQTLPDQLNLWIKALYRVLIIPTYHGHCIGPWFRLLGGHMVCLSLHVVETGLESGLPALHPPLGFQVRHVPQMQNNLIFLDFFFREMMFIFWFI